MIAVKDLVHTTQPRPQAFASLLHAVLVRHMTRQCHSLTRRREARHSCDARALHGGARRMSGNKTTCGQATVFMFHFNLVSPAICISVSHGCRQCNENCTCSKSYMIIRVIFWSVRLVFISKYPSIKSLVGLAITTKNTIN